MDRYDVKNYLSAGAQAETYIALDKQTSELVILKIASKKCLDERQKEQLLREGRIQQRIDSPYVIKVYECFETEDSVVTVLQYA